MTTRLYRSNDGGAWVLEHDGSVTFFDVRSSFVEWTVCPDCGHAADVHGVRCSDGLTVCFVGNCVCGLL